jgi:hypothetical protein
MEPRARRRGKTLGKTPGNTYIFIRKYQEISVNIEVITKKFQDILGNIRKYYEIPGNTRPKT